MSIADLMEEAARASEAAQTRASAWATCACGEPYDPKSAKACDVCLERARRQRRVLAAAGIPEHYAWARFGFPELAARVHDPVAVERVRRWSGLGRLVLVNPVPQVGKTVLGTCAFVSCILDRGTRSALWVDAPALGAARGSFGRDPEVLTRALHDELLLLDDLGAGRRSDDDVIARVIFDRFQHDRATIITVGMTSEDLGARFGGALQARVIKGATLVRVGEPQVP